MERSTRHEAPNLDPGPRDACFHVPRPMLPPLSAHVKMLLDFEPSCNPCDLGDFASFKDAPTFESPQDAPDPEISWAHLLLDIERDLDEMIDNDIYMNHNVSQEMAWSGEVDAEDPGSDQDEEDCFMGIFDRSVSVARERPNFHLRWLELPVCTTPVSHYSNIPDALVDVAPPFERLVQLFNTTLDEPCKTDEAGLGRKLMGDVVCDALSRLLRGDSLTPADELDLFLSEMFDINAVDRNIRNKQVLGSTAALELPDYHGLASFPLPLLVYANYSNEAPSTNDWLSSFPVFGICVPQHRRPLKHAGRWRLTFCQPVTSDARSTPYISGGHQRQRHWRSAFTLMAILSGTHALALSSVVERALRIASGVTASGAATSVIPLRTIDGVPSWAWISDYAVWMMCFITYLALQVHHIDHHNNHRRQLYLFLVILLATHFAIALAQSAPTLIDGFTIFGPMVLTVTTFLVALLFGAAATMEARGGDAAVEENTTNTPHHADGIAMEARGGHDSDERNTPDRSHHLLSIVLASLGIGA